MKAVEPSARAWLVRLLNNDLGKVVVCFESHHLLVFYLSNRRVAQLVELRFPKPSVGGSSPFAPASFLVLFREL